MLTTVTFRYLGTLLQFVVLAVIARATTADDYGLYMLCLSLTFSFYYILGLGSSESALAQLARDRALGDDSNMGQITGAVLGLTATCALILLTGAALIALIQPLEGPKASAAAIFVLIFLSTNGVIFNVSQLLLGWGRTSLGAFFFYPAINLTLLCSTVPAALLLPDAQFTQLCVATSIGSILAATGALVSTFRVTRRVQLSWSANRAGSLIRAGVGLTTVRILHVSSFWIPTMVTGLLLTPALAGVMGTSGRLAIAVSAVIAATRFAIRPAINRALARQEIDELRSVLGAVAFISTGVALVALVTNEAIGTQVIGYFFGEDLAVAAPILSILLLSVCAEAVFGPVDELLKASGQQKTVAWIYGIGVPAFFLGCLLLANWGLMWIAWFQVVYVLCIFTAMNLAVRHQFGFAIFPRIPKPNELRQLR
jgi:O-antigen/teichoic acid export membrane protein